MAALPRPQRHSPWLRVVGDRPEPEADREPPHDLDAERAVLAAVLLDRDAIGPLYDLLDPDDFYASAHRAIFAAMCDLFERRVPADPYTLNDALERDGTCEEVGGLPAVAALLDPFVPTSHCEHHARQVRECAERRRAIAHHSAEVARAWDRRTPWQAPPPRPAVRYYVP